MKKTLLALSALALLSTPALAAPAAKTYQVTGPVIALTDSTITVQKGKEKWEIAKGDATVPADVKVGSKVTIEYSMTAATVTAKTMKAPTTAAAKTPAATAPAAGAPASAPAQ
jgi:hypothetical protein